MLIHKREGSKGFTIVELLIVVVIIAILAAITLVTYNGIQQRANNAAIIDAASKSLRMIQAYIAANDKYPLVFASSNGVCVTVDTGCVTSSGSPFGANSTLINNVSSIGNLPSKVPASGTFAYGITYAYDPARTMNGVVQPAVLIYFLEGTSQQCGLAGVAVMNGSGSILITSSTGYTEANFNSSGKTHCRVSIPGPTA